MTFHQYKLMWLLQYSPCHDHDFPDDAKNVGAYWGAYTHGPDFSAMATAIRLK